MAESRPDAVRGAVPGQNRFREGGLYFGEKDPPGSFTTWDAGTWEVSGAGQIKLSTANDAVIAYELKLNGADLMIIDKHNCEILYRRA